MRIQMDIGDSVAVQGVHDSQGSVSPRREYPIVLVEFSRRTAGDGKYRLVLRWVPRGEPEGYRSRIDGPDIEHKKGISQDGRCALMLDMVS